MNLVDPTHARLFTEKEFKRILDDISYECTKHIPFEHIFVIKNHNSTIGAEPGAVFVVTNSKERSLDVAPVSHSSSAR